MKEIWKLREWDFSEKLDKRILPVKDLTTIDGSEQHFALLVSSIDEWESQNEFLQSLPPMFSGGIDSKINTSDRVYFDRLLAFLNEIRPDEITITPRFESKRIVLTDNGFSTAIMWQEHERYYIYCWSTSA